MPASTLKRLPTPEPDYSLSEAIVPSFVTSQCLYFFLLYYINVCHHALTFYRKECALTSDNYSVTHIQVIQ